MPSIKKLKENIARGVDEVIAEQERLNVKRFLLFCFDQYYPEGGWHDFNGDFDSIEDARIAMSKPGPLYDYYHIVDSATHKIVDKGGFPYD